MDPCPLCGEDKLFMCGAQTKCGGCGRVIMMTEPVKRQFFAPIVAFFQKLNTNIAKNFKKWHQANSWRPRKRGEKKPFDSRVFIRFRWLWRKLRRLTKKEDWSKLKESSTQRLKQYNSLFTLTFAVLAVISLWFVKVGVEYKNATVWMFATMATGWFASCALYSADKDLRLNNIHNVIWWKTSIFWLAIWCLGIF